MGAGQESFTLDDTARASNPGRLDVQPLVYSRCFPRLALVYGSLLIAVSAAGLLLHWAWWLAGLPVLLAGISRWTRVEEHFLYGCTCPGRVVSTRPFLIAVHTDLRRSLKRFPAIKVLRQPLERGAGKTLQVGDRVAAVALYARSESQERWEDFHPLAAPCVTGSLRDLDRVLRSIPEDEWHELDAALALVPTPDQPGLYLIPAEELPPPAHAAPGRPEPPPQTKVEGLRLVLPSAPVLPWAAALFFLADTLVVERSLLFGALLLAAALGLAVYGDLRTQQALGEAGWLRHPFPMRLGYWLLGAGATLEALAGAEAVSAAMAASLKQGFFAVSIGGLILAVLGQASWYRRLDRRRRAVVDYEARRYRRLITVLILLAIVVGTAVGVYRRSRRPTIAVPNSSARQAPTGAAGAGASETPASKPGTAPAPERSR